MSARPARLLHLALRDFRNLARVELDAPADGFVVIGENGQGKTNLLESIYYLQILRSTRGARDQDLVRFGADSFHIGASVDAERCHEIGIGFERTGKRKRVRLDGAIPEKLTDALGALPSVMFSPTDVELISGAPSARRRFLDIMLALTGAPRGYLGALQSYRAALARRNAALREHARANRANPSAVSVWEPALAKHGAALFAERRAWVTAIESRFTELCREIGETGRVVIRYSSSLNDTEDPAAALVGALAERRAGDLRRGLTSVGPHRDDLSITLEDPSGTPRELRSFGSAGQQRSAAIALRMLEAATFTERTGRAPLFLLDDPFAELDVRRSTRVLELLTRNGLGQTILAVPRENDIPIELTSLARQRMHGGELV
ncbi:MAG: DNA replication and repair protein RecF [Gemmatimonadaceae bacterium]